MKQHKKNNQLKNNNTLQTNSPNLELVDNFFEKYAIWILGAITFLGLYLRLYNVTYLTLWMDEYNHVLPAKSFATGKGSLFAGETNGVLITMITGLFFKLFGVTDSVARVVCAVMATSAIPLIYILAKKVYNTPVALISALFTSISLYMLFYGRVVRNFAGFTPAYIALVFVFLMAYHISSVEKNKEILRWLIFILMFIIALLGSQLAFFIFFSIGVYGSMFAIENIINKKENRFKDKNAIVFYLTIIGAIVLITPLSSAIMRPIFLKFLPENAVDWILPNWQKILEAFKNETTKHFSFDKYFGILEYDFKNLYLLSVLGIVVSYFKNRKAFYFIISFFIVPFLLQSYVFRDPCLPRYINYIYPLYLISGAYGIYYLVFELGSKIFKFKKINRFSIIAGITCILLVLAISKTKETKAYINANNHGKVISDTLSEWVFTSWKEPINYVKQQMKKDDVVMSTVVQSSEFYFDNIPTVWFRQYHRDSKKGGFVLNEIQGKGNSATTFEDLQRTFNSNNRGWLLADYYFYNALTDPRCRDFIIKNCEYHFDASKDGYVQVFSWDKSKPKTHQTPLCIDLGKREDKQASEEIQMTLPAISVPEVTFTALAEAVDTDNEVILSVNGNNLYMKRENPNIKSGMQILFAKIPASQLKVGQNSVQFGYDSNNYTADIRKGFVIYNLEAKN